MKCYGIKRHVTRKEERLTSTRGSFFLWVWVLLPSTHICHFCAYKFFNDDFFQKKVSLRLIVNAFFFAFLATAIGCCSRSVCYNWTHLRILSCNKVTHNIIFNGINSYTFYCILDLWYNYESPTATAVWVCHIFWSNAKSLLINYIWVFHCSTARVVNLCVMYSYVVPFSFNKNISYRIYLIY